MISIKYGKWFAFIKPYENQSAQAGRSFREAKADIVDLDKRLFVYHVVMAADAFNDLGYRETSASGLAPLCSWKSSDVDQIVDS